MPTLRRLYTPEYGTLQIEEATKNRPVTPMGAAGRFGLAVVQVFAHRSISSAVSGSACATFLAACPMMFTLDGLLVTTLIDHHRGWLDDGAVVVDGTRLGVGQPSS